MTTTTKQEAPLIAELRALLGERLSTSAAVRDQHGHDESFHPTAAPDAVVFPDSTEEVSAIVAACTRHGTPIIPFGAGSSLEGHVQALHGGVTLNMTRMNRILSVNSEDMDAVVQSGVTRKQLNSYLRDTGLFFSVDPGADATLGGMAATAASGTNTVRYGTMRENVLGLTVVLADGRVIHTGGRARKTSAGYNLTALLVGSEGTLGVITEVITRLHGNAEAVTAAVCSFNHLDDAVQATIQTIQMGIPVARIELLDGASMRAINSYSGLTYPETSTLFFEFEGSEKGAAADATTVQEIVAEFGSNDFQWASDEDERRRLWQARHNAYYACLAQFPGSRGIIADACVPISRLTECVTATQADIERSSARACIAGHVGDGNFHVVFCVDPENKAEIEEAEALNERIVERALAMGGTCTGEHGIGYGKMGFLEKQHGDNLDTMRAIKRALDPDNLMNPGKVIAV